LKYHDEENVPERYTKEGIARRSGAENREKPRRFEPGELERSSSEETVVDADREESRGQEGDKASKQKGGKGNGGGKDRATEQEGEGGEKEKGNDPNLVDWYGEDDPENPYNWSTPYKSFVAFQMALLTFSVYIGSSIYSSGIQGPNPDSVTQHFDVSVTTALVGLTVFVAGYGVGPMIWSPLSDFPAVGRLPVYVVTLVIFVGLQFPTIYANNIHTLLAMRFFAGFFGSPCLAIGGATMGDMFRPKHLAYAIGVWGCGAVCGPVIGPLLGGFTYQAKGWTWPLWVLVWLSGGCLVLIVLFFPETSGKTILHRRMKRLQKSTGNPNLKTQAEIDGTEKSGGAIAKEILWRPFVLFFEPILLVYNIYLALIYGLLYIWFESFPLIFQEGHGYNPGESGLAFLGIFVGAWLSCGCFCIYVHKCLGPIFDANNGTLPDPEIRLKPATIAAVCIPIALFGSGWAGQYPDKVNAFVVIMFTGFFGVGAFILFQCIFAYFGDVYYAEIGSVLTLNDLFRSSYGAGFPLFAGALFSHLGIGGGSSLLGGIACLFIPAPYLFIRYGKQFRARSKYASKIGIPQELLRK